MKKENKQIQKIRRHLQSPMQTAYARAVRYISALMAVLLAISPQVMQKVANVDFINFPVYAVYDGITIEDTDTETQESISNEVTLTTPTTDVVPVTSIVTTTTTITTTTIVTTEEPTEPTTEEVVEEAEESYYEYEEEDTYEEEYVDDYYEEEVVYEEDYDDSYYGGTYTAKWYSGSVGSYGKSGRDLISGYSVASPDFPQGTILYITGGGLDGEYRVDDSGCPSGVIDFFYFYGEVPPDFEYNGVYQVEVTVIGQY